ncbi:unnamed protein product [Owenia fusiformis]|uniref:Uncharacterized protein n=1 Tax=Owenia fusiformis TaxID=6347 RepID=A0A8J1XP48_OWEFU|nr:unnamed protein product [Owenia fusiformis]
MKTIIGISILLCFLKLTNAQTNCTGSPDRLITYGCRAFTACKNETFFDIECPPGQVVDTERILCDDPENVPPPCGGSRNCTGREDGGYPDYFNNCTSFYTCQNGVNRGTSFCPGGLVYDDDRDLCDRPNNVCEPCGNLPAANCLPTEAFTGSTVTTEEMTTTNVTTEPPIYRNCTGRPDGYYPDLETGCSWYFTCAAGIMSGFFQCPQGLVFDPEDKTCDWPYAACPPCGTGTSKEPGYCKNCTDISNGLQPDLDDFCSGAYTCEFDLMVFRGSCPPGSIYDPQRLDCTNNTDDVCPPCYNGSGNPPERCEPTTETPTTEPPITNSTDTETSGTEAPPGTEEPSLAPSTKAPSTPAPSIAPNTDEPSLAPSTKAPSTPAPSIAPSTKAPSSDIPAGSTVINTESPTQRSRLAQQDNDENDILEDDNGLVQIEHPKFPKRNK